VRGLAEFSEALEAHLNTLHNLCLLHLRLLARSDPADELVHARPARAGDPKSSSSRAAPNALRRGVWQARKEAAARLLGAVHPT
jgi:hypothetical protein